MWCKARTHVHLASHPFSKFGIFLPPTILVKLLVQICLTAMSQNAFGIIFHHQKKTKDINGVDVIFFQPPVKNVRNYVFDGFFSKHSILICMYLYDCFRNSPVSPFIVKIDSVVLPCHCPLQKKLYFCHHTFTFVHDYFQNSLATPFVIKIL